LAAVLGSSDSSSVVSQASLALWASWEWGEEAVEVQEEVEGSRLLERSE
jgi:hypothetical protein